MAESDELKIEEAYQKIVDHQNDPDLIRARVKHDEGLRDDLYDMFKEHLSYRHGKDGKGKPKMMGYGGYEGKDKDKHVEQATNKFAEHLLEHVLGDKGSAHAFFKKTIVDEESGAYELSLKSDKAKQFLDAYLSQALPPLKQRGSDGQSKDIPITYEGIKGIIEDSDNLLADHFDPNSVYGQFMQSYSTFRNPHFEDFGKAQQRLSQPLDPKDRPKAIDWINRNILKSHGVQLNLETIADNLLPGIVQTYARGGVSAIKQLIKQRKDEKLFIDLPTE